MGALEEDNVVGPRPVQWILLQQWTLEHRRIHCVSYDACLAKAVKLHWEGWSCCECNVREDNPDDRDSATLLREVWEDLGLWGDPDGGTLHSDDESA